MVQLVQLITLKGNKMPSDKFTKATLTKDDKVRIEAIKRKLTILAEGKAVSEAEVIRWLIELGEQELEKKSDITVSFRSRLSSDRLPPVSFWPPQGETVTYFVQGDDPNVVKIGITDRMQNRIRGLQTASSNPVVVVAWIMGNQEMELHKRFGKMRVRGEWFNLSEEMRTYISKVASDIVSDGKEPYLGIYLESTGFSCPCGVKFTKSQDKAIHARRCNVWREYAGMSRMS